MHVLLNNVFDEAVKMDFIKSLLENLDSWVHVLNILCDKMESRPEVL